MSWPLDNTNAKAARERRIIPISSGKGGVGKTTLALNYALCLSRHGPTVLIDLDTGTSSVRSCVDTPVERDLYHFFKKGYTLSDCITTLGPRLDPGGLFPNFGFIASPKHLIEDITNFTPARRNQVIDAVNELPARFIVLDLKAGLDSNVIEFLPYSNSGILVFTPYLSAATLAASDIVKAILFRKLRILFAPGSLVYDVLPGITSDFVNGLIDRVEDVYDSSLHNLDAFVVDLQHALGDHAVVKLVANAVETFMVYFVLNRFNGVKDSYETAIQPFVQSLAENVSGHPTIFNLGWIVEHEQINQSNIRRVPILLQQDPVDQKAPEPEHVPAELKKLAALYLPARKARSPIATRAVERPDVSRYLDVQLDTLRRMYEDMRGASYRENFEYVVSRSLHIMSGRRTSDFGDTRLYKATEFAKTAQRRGR